LPSLTGIVNKRPVDTDVTTSRSMDKIDRRIFLKKTGAAGLVALGSGVLMAPDGAVGDGAYQVGRAYGFGATFVQAELKAR
jgi:hypothetical protein